MAWNPQGGGQGPWGRGTPGPQPPDIEELLRRGQDKFKRFLPGGMGTARAIILAVIAIAAIWLASGLYRIESGHKGLVLLFGKNVAETDPGLHWFFPAPIGEVVVPNIERLRRVDVGFRTAGTAARDRAGAVRDLPEESLMITGDQNIADLDFTVLWKVSNPANFVFNIRDPETTVKVAAESAMREVIGQTPLQDALAGGKEIIQNRTRDLLQTILDGYGAGISIDTVQLQKVDPPGAVIDAFNEVQRARQDKERKLNEAQAYRNKIVPTARGEAAQITQNATAYKEKVTKEAEGEAARFLAIYESFKTTEDVARQRLYLETMEEVLSGANKVIIDSKGGAGSGVIPYLPLPELQKRSGGTAK
jgi:membrane protease subunit HflK